MADSQRPRIALPIDAGKPRRSAPVAVFVAPIVTALVGALIAWFAAKEAERRSDFDFHVEQLAPLLAHNPEYYRQAKRSMNDDMRLVAYQMYCVTSEGLDLRAALEAAMPVADVPPNLKTLMIKRLLENHQQALDYGLLTPENVARLMKGESPTITKGAHKGQRADVEHIVPVNF
ncbi:MAG: hypothetical protein AAF387_21500 [Pseudomonadota bacterium]